MIRLIRSEVYKLRTTPGPWVLLGIDMLLSGLIIWALFRGAASDQGLPGYAAPRTVHQLQNFLAVGVESALILAPIVGVLCITSEYRHKVLTTTLLVAPRRTDVLVAKGVASMLWGIFMALGSLFMVATEGLIWFTADHGSFSALGHQVAPVIPGLFAVFALLALFGVGIGILVKNQVAGVLITIGGTLLVEQLIVALFENVLHLTLNWLPSESALALAGGAFGNRGSSGPGRVLLPWWGGGLSLLAWAIVPAVLGYFTTFRRDVT